jgi:predicted signal transduction protein with EAL and GGDEF domain
LSSLVGNLKKLSKCVVSTTKYSVAYLDIDNFKAYNDAYGFKNGYITTANRYGEKEQLPLINLT